MKQVSVVSPVERQPVVFREVTLRDGEQQQKIHAIMPIEDRIDVFDRIIDTGISTIEIGHLGNNHDQELARNLVEHIQKKTDAGDERYEAVELQAIFGSQRDKTEGIEALDGLDPDRVVVHVYDRVSPQLRHLATDPFSVEESAARVMSAAEDFADRGYTNFSVSGEGAIDPDVIAAEVAERFYIPIGNFLKELGATAININLPNTFGSALEGEWSPEGLALFNSLVKGDIPGATTSLHTHNDNMNAVEASMTAVKAGFDGIEGTMIGMGERSGNVALVDVAAMFLEVARQVTEVVDKGESASHIARDSIKDAVVQRRMLDPKVLANIGNWYEAASAIAQIYGAKNRFFKTSLGNPEAYGAGSGPHARANLEALKDPVKKPLWMNYARVALTHAMMGRPEARQIINIDPARYRAITLDTHAAGGSTVEILESEIQECSEEARRDAIEMARAVSERVLETAGLQPDLIEV